MKCRTNDLQDKWFVGQPTCHLNRGAGRGVLISKYHKMSTIISGCFIQNIQNIPFLYGKYQVSTNRNHPDIKISTEIRPNIGVSKTPFQSLLITLMQSTSHTLELSVTALMSCFHLNPWIRGLDPPCPGKLRPGFVTGLKALCEPIAPYQACWQKLFLLKTTTT